MDELYKFDLCFCSSHRIFRACSSLIRNVFVCSRLNFCSFFNFCTSEPICFFHVYSVSAVLLFPLCAALWVVCGLGPGNRCLQLYLGAEPEGLDPYCYCMFYYYYSSFRPMGVYGSPMKGTWENDEIWHTCRDGYE